MSMAFKVRRLDRIKAVSGAREEAGGLGCVPSMV